MIRLTRPALAPDVLLLRGPSQTADDAAHPDLGKPGFKFNDDIFNGPGVKDALVAMQSGKCAFCEFAFRAGHRGNVEHYRPKGAVTQAEGQPLQYPGYYWLAYDWGNLFLSCEICNQSFKRNLFPLRNPTRRARHHTHPLDREKPLLVNPATANPRRHIGFRREVAFAVNGSKAGVATIAILGLNTRAELVERRRKHLRLLMALQTLLNLLREKQRAGTISPVETAEQARAATLLEEVRGATWEFSSMARDFFTPR